MDRQSVSSGTPWEVEVGYRRAVRVGRIIAVSGTTATGEDGRIAWATAFEQTAQALQNIDRALTALGARRQDVIRTRIFVTRIDDWREVGRAHAAFFGDDPPATSMVEVSRLVDPAMLVEIEADAVVGGE